MPMGTFQNNNLLHLTLDTWHDEVFFNGVSYLAGYFATQVLNMELEAMRSLIGKAGAISNLVEELGMADREKLCALLPQARDQVSALLDDLWSFPPYSFLDRGAEDEVLGTIFSEDALDQLMDGTSEVRRFFFRYLTACFSIPLGIYHFGWACDYFVSHYLARLKQRKEDSFAVAAHDCFNSQDFWAEMAGLPLADIEAFTVSPRQFSTYVFARNPKAEKELIFVNRSRFETAIEFYCFDLLNGLHHGHAPSQCLNCGRFFLTVNGHRPKYCDGNDPERPELTCREKGALLHLSENNEEHPIYQLFRTRANTIRKHEQRGKISHAVREATILQAAKYRDRALLDKKYAKGQYEKDMETDHLYAVIQKKK